MAGELRLRVAKGSSPLTRGKRPSGAYRKNHPRLIPAHAGKTVFCRLRSTVSRAHPRSRGENIQGEDASHVRAGSSPLTRGKRVYRCEVWGLVRLIPAHAGKTQRAAPGSSRRTAHPRSRGENKILRRRTLRSWGSSPLTRGKLELDSLPAPGARLIPAHAGKTSMSSALRRRSAAHPRSRGENFLPVTSAHSRPGSSPLTRGKPRRLLRRRYRPRLIPAHAGKTGRDHPSRSYRGAHPRSRGENRVVKAPTGWERGSSPLTRGKHFLTCAFTAQIDQILESLELAVSSGSYSIWVACATDAPQDQVQSIGLVLPSSRDAS